MTTYDLQRAIRDDSSLNERSLSWHLGALRDLIYSAHHDALTEHILSHWPAFVGHKAKSACVLYAEDVLTTRRNVGVEEWRAHDVSVEDCIIGEVIRRSRRAGVSGPRLRDLGDFRVEIFESSWVTHELKWIPGRTLWVLGGASSARVQEILRVEDVLLEETIRKVDAISNGLFSYDMGVDR